MTQFLNFFLSVHREKKIEQLSHFGLKSWVTGGIRILIRPNFLGQNDSIFFSQCTKKKNWVILTWKVESLAE